MARKSTKPASAKRKSGPRAAPGRKAAAKRVAKKKSAPKKEAPSEKTPEQAEKSDGVKRGHAKNQEELCKILGISRSTLARYLRRDGHPGKKANGGYPIQPWVEFHEQQKKNYSVDDAEALLEKKAKRRRAEVALEIEQLELDQKRGLLEDRDEVVKVVGQAFGAMVQHLKEADHALAHQVAGLDVAEATEVLRQRRIEAMERFSLGDWAKKKPFWGPVYAELRGLLETLNRGSGQSGT